MSLQTMSIPAGATLSAAGGTAKSFTPDGLTVASGIHLADASVTDFRVRPNMTIKVKQPSLDAAGVYSKDKKSVTYVVPKILASGKTVFNLIRIEREIHPESTAAEQDHLLNVGAQLLFDTDVTAFWSSGSLA